MWILLAVASGLSLVLVPLLLPALWLSSFLNGPGTSRPKQGWARSLPRASRRQDGSSWRGTAPRSPSPQLRDSRLRASGDPTRERPLALAPARRP